MAGIFDAVITQGVRSGQIPARTEQARQWYREKAKGHGRIRSERTVLRNEDPDRLTSTIKPGDMYMYIYDPKNKETLPFYDIFPLVFPFKVESDRFWGINLHYLPLPYRAILMDGLYDLVNNQRYDESTRLNLSYKILKQASKLRYFKPCVKQYLFNHLESKFMYMYPSEWDIALFLPTEKFKKKSKTQVFANSKELIRADR